MGRDVLVGFACASGIALLGGCAFHEEVDAQPANGGGETGSLSMSLEVDGDVDLDEVHYTLTPQRGPSLTGSIPITAGTGDIHGMIPDVPAGHVSLELKGIAHNGALCGGTAKGKVTGGRTSLIAILLQCLLNGVRGAVEVKGQVNVCPVAELATCAPASAHVGSAIALTASAADGDGDPIAFLWSADAGSFSAPSEQSTQYTCDTPGTHTLEFTADDGRGCTDTHAFTVVCEAADGDHPDAGNSGNGDGNGDTTCDAGSPPQPDAGQGGAAGSGGSGGDGDGNGGAVDCDACRAECEEPPPSGPLCNAATTGFIARCTCDNCSEEVAAVENAMGVAAAGPGAGRSRADLAVALVQCAQRTTCRGVECLCGTAGPVLCFSVGGNGPCIPEFLAAAETTSPGTAASLLEDTTFALGLANDVMACMTEQCDSQCP